MLVWDVGHPEHETVRVEAQDRLHAVVEAAHAWGIVKWTDVARECKAEIVGETKEKPKRPAGKPSQKKGAKA